MGVVAGILVGLVALIHVYILVLEMFLWTTPRGQKAFGLTPEFAEATKTLGANQGLYNGFLAAGLIWSLIAADPVGYQAKIFFLVCVFVAGVYGAATASKKILYVQVVPSVLALAAVLVAG
ncbi:MULTISPECIES: DUF1304 domain-containing protein [unclassified Crossiella]|uniref:DUF1304 domain-containing protein n=1 Tax=unclassified Crossiella TaxID=2620835 RepID=UPI001FFE6E95|nr:MULTISPECIES: DUF1304 domain-containing protein [unclassified Crossiella]MCK2242893.1 DUF1304 domain-containing protein [Crossiella sp. S99.2]MCK2256770.1 DUF1304 domain-containing protein [Crossiella sp. S99.1]